MSEDNLQIEVPASDLADLDEFEQARNEIYKSTHAGEPDRVQRLTELAGSMALKKKQTDSDKTISVLNHVLDTVTSGNPVQSVDGPRYRLTVGADGDIADVSFVKSIREDVQITARAQNASARIGWGPKQNSSSFRTNLQNVPRKSAHI